MPLKCIQGSSSYSRSEVKETDEDIHKCMRLEKLGAQTLIAGKCGSAA